MAAEGPHGLRAHLGITATLALVMSVTSIGTGGYIITRHDREDARYLELGARYPAVCRVGIRIGDGTLVGDRWILTAAHVATALVRRSPKPMVHCGDRAYAVEGIVTHPDWTEMGPHDIGLIRLSEPVNGIAPLGLYSGSDERGQTAVLVGHGRTGTGNSRDRRDDDKRRGATNRIDDTGPWMIMFTFDAPPAGTDLEGIPGAGDSGGPALIVRSDGQPLVAGVSVAGEPGTNGPGTYGARDHFTRVSTHVAWLRKAMN